MIVIEAEVTVETFVECLIERLRKDGRAIPDDGLEIRENEFTLVVRSAISTLLVQGVLETHTGKRRLVLYVCPDLETVKAVSKVISLGTKALELSGAIAGGPAGMLVLAGKFGVEKLMERRTKERELRRFQQLVDEVCEIDLQLEEHLIEPVALGLPQTTEKAWMRWEYTYRAVLDIIELRMQTELPEFFKMPVKLFRDRPFKDGTVDLFGILREEDTPKGFLFLVTNRKPSATPFRANEITRIVRQAMHYRTSSEAPNGIVICIFVSATTPAYDAKIWQVLAQNPYIPGVDNPFPLTILLPPNRDRWHNVLPPPRPNVLEKLLTRPLQMLGLLKTEEIEGLPPQISVEVYMHTYQELIGLWTRILTPQQVQQVL